jgi:hypothetical protein
MIKNKTINKSQDGEAGNEPSLTPKYQISSVRPREAIPPLRESAVGHSEHQNKGVYSHYTKSFELFVNQKIDKKMALR